MVSCDEMRGAVSGLVGAEVPLVQHAGRGRVVAADSAGVELVVEGIRTPYTWGRLEAALQRLAANHTLGIDELGGGTDAVGIVSLIAAALGDSVRVSPVAGQVVLLAPEGRPIHQYSDMSGVSRRWPRHRRVVPRP